MSIMYYSLIFELVWVIFVHCITYDPPNHSEGIRLNWILCTNHVGIQGLVGGGDRCWLV